MQLEKDEQTKKSQQEGAVQQMEEELHLGTLTVMDQQWQEVTNDMAKQLVVMESGAPANGDLDVVVEQLEMLAQKIRKKNGEVQKLQKENERMAKQLEETQSQLANQVEKTFYEKNQRI
jgi:predicted RNA-binding protein with PIN domain